MRILGILLILFNLAGASLAQEEQDALASWVDVWEKHGPAITATALELAEAIDWEYVGQSIQNTLQSVSWQDVAALRPQAENALVILRQYDEGIPYADWLEPRLDYIDMAARLLKRTKPPTTPPPPRTPQSVPRPSPKPTPKAPEPKWPRTRLAPETERWKQALRHREVPRNAERLKPGLQKAFAREGVPTELIWVAEVESSFNPKARSPVGAAGLFQFMPATAEQYGLALKPTDERLVPEKSATASAKYLKALHKRFHSWPLALAAYNAGEGRVSKLLRRRNGSEFNHIADDLPVETRMYVPKVLATIALREGVDPKALPPPSA